MTIKLQHSLTQLPPIYLCHGAENDESHTLQFAAVEGSPWINQQLSLHAGEGTSPLTLTFEPSGLQSLKPDGAEWQIGCPAGGTDRDFDLSIQSEFTAAPYRIPVRLGHYRRVLLRSSAPISAPVIGDTVTAEVSVGSYYLLEQPVEGVDVEWFVDDKPVCTVTTDARGVSLFEHTVATAGDVTITAKFESPYDAQVVEKSFKITVHADSPWEQATLRVNDTIIEWEDPIFLLRGQENTVTVEVPSSIADELQLEWVKVEGLEPVASPAFGTWNQRAADTEQFHWTVTPEQGLSGNGKLLFLSHEVLQHWELSCRVVSSNLSDEVESIEVGGAVSPSDGVLFWRDAPQTVTVTFKSGSPLHDYDLALEATPVSGVVDGNLDVTDDGRNVWTVEPHTNSGRFDLTLSAAAFSAGITLPTCRVMSQDLADEVDKIKIDGKDFPAAGVLFFRNDAQTITLTYKQHSPVANHPLLLTATPLTGLESAHLEVTKTAEHTWTVKPHTKSGTFKLELTGTGMTKGIVPPTSKVMSKYLDEEAEVRIDGVAVPAVGSYFFFRGKERTLKLVPKSGSPLAGHPVTLTCSIKSGLDPANVVSQPALGAAQTVHSWAITGSTKSGTFQLSLAGERMTRPITVPLSTLVSTALRDEFEARLNNQPLPADITLDDQKFGLSLVAKNNIAGIPVKLKFNSGTGITKDKLRVEPGFDQDVTAHQWALVADVNTAATFNLGFQSGLSGMTEPLNIAFKLPSLKLPDAVFAGHPVVAGKDLNAVRGGRHVIRVDAGSSVYLGTKAKVELVGEAALGTISPASWQVMNPSAEFVFDAANTKNGDFQLKITYERTPTQTVSVKVMLREDLPVIIDIVPAQDKFYEGELGLFNVTVAAKSNASILLDRAELGIFFANIDWPHDHTNNQGKGVIKILWARGKYTIVPWARLEGGEKQLSADVSFEVYPK